MDDYDIDELIMPYLEKTIEKKDRKTSGLLLYIFEKFPFFKKIKRSYKNSWQIMYNNIIAHLVFKEFEVDDIIYNYGEEISDMCIIIKGKVNIYEKNKNSDIKSFNESNFNNIIENFIKKNKINNDNKIEEEHKLYFSHQLLKGNSIGDENLKYDNKNINYMAKTASRCLIGFLSNDNYQKIFGKANVIEKTVITGFISRLNYFDESKYTKNLLNHITKQFYEKESLVFSQDSPFKTFYVIYKGTINISLQLKRTVKSLIDREFLLGNKPMTDRFTSSRIHELKSNYKERNNFNLVNYEEGELIGGIEFMKNLDKYIYTAKCLTNVEIIEFNIRDLSYLDKIRQSEKFKLKIKEQIKILGKRIEDINNNFKKNSISLKHNKFVKTFLENHPYKETKKANKYLHNNLFENKNIIYKSIKFLKKKFRPISVNLKNYIKHNKTGAMLFKENNISFKSSKGINRRAISPNINLKVRRNEPYKFRKNKTEIQYHKNLSDKNKIINKENLKKNLSLNENNSITTNMGTKSSFYFTDRYISERFNSYSYNFYNSSTKKKINKSTSTNKIERYSEYKNKFNIKTNRSNFQKHKFNSINLFKVKKSNNKINMKNYGIKQLFRNKDNFLNNKKLISSILKKMSFSQHIKKQSINI